MHTQLVCPKARPCPCFKIILKREIPKPNAQSRDFEYKNLSVIRFYKSSHALPSACNTLSLLCPYPRTCGIGCVQPAFLRSTSTFHYDFFLWMCFVFERTLDSAFWFISIDFFGILSQLISVIYFFTSLKTFALICFPFYKTDDIPLNHSPTSVLINFSFKKN